MASRFGVVDIPALTKLTWDLHNQCHAVTKHAPDGFKRLVTELGTLQGFLRTFGDDMTSHASFLKTMDADRRQTLQRTLGTCFTTLQRLKDLLVRFKSLDIGDGKGFWQRVKWATQRSHIEDIRSKIMVHSCNLSLCISSIGNASLARIEQTMVLAMEEDEQLVLSTEPSPVRETDSIVSPMSPGVVELPANNEDNSELDLVQLIRARMSELSTETVSVDSDSNVKAKGASTPSESVMTASDESIFDGTSPTSWLSINTSSSLPQNTMKRFGHSRMRSEQLLFGGSIDGRTLDGELWAKDSDLEEKQVVHPGSSSLDVDFGHTHVMEAVSSAMQRLRHVRQQEQISRPIRYVPRIQMHRPSPEVMKIFDASLEDELKSRRLITSDWLCVATWWMLKCNRHNYVSARGSLSPSTDSMTTSHQAYLDLLKASYILYDVVLKEENSPALMTDENRKLIAEISEGINEELSQYTSVDIPEPSSLQSQSLEIWEPMQQEEISDTIVDLSLGLDNSRWISVDIEDAGSEQEKVLYRTFVNAGIGGKKSRIRTKSAPYLLLLATREGESEPKIILRNQRGSFCLERSFTLNDIPPLIQLLNAILTGFPGSRISEPVPLNFDETSVSITFQFEGDLRQLIDIPKTYFEAVCRREPVDAADFTESVIFKSSVDFFEQLNTPSMKTMNPPVVAKSCEVRILERSFEEAWRSIRRMVISSSIAEKVPQTIELFMPLSRVRINREDISRQVLLQWSDTCQARSNKTDGNYNVLHSYVYDDSAPNLGFRINFCTHQCADDFEKAVLDTNLPCNFSWSQPSSSGRIYDVVDSGIERKQYKAVSISRNRASWRYSDLYFIYRDADYDYEHSSLSINFPKVTCTDYISTHVDQLYHPETSVTFSHCDKKSSQMNVEFTTDPVARSFLSSLSPLFDILYSRRVQSISIKAKSFLGFQKSGKGGADVQLWRRGTTFQLAARWNDSVPDKWLTMSLPSEFIDSSKDNNRVILPRLPFFRGMTLDMMNIMARSPKNSNGQIKEGALSILFQTIQGELGLCELRLYPKLITSGEP
ncbi:uncharacterized protein N7511_001686 [Penicillium nucicola]|uniref:uncharacterized protein n=1 Tax=Penicillium nucicola TaxID=1850975 RepID=UPI002544F8A3|nr:uncharacterized protein N7511_001686 [Penicillium nucicola]KAJ5776675.1 hypothetical protein N7511_001686 [Penicillium nucicola]